MFQDLRFALRSLRSSPGFAAVTILTLALGIGSNAAIFSLGNWVAWRPVPGVRDPGEVVTVEFLRFRQGARPSGTAVSYPDILDFAGAVTALSQIAAYNPGTFGLAPRGAVARRLEGAYVTQNYFSMLGVRFWAGTGFTPEQERAAAAAPVAVISHPLWRSAFAEDRDIIGRTVPVNGVGVMIVGVTPPGFRGARLLGNDDVWMPISAQETMGHRPPRDLLALRGPGKTFNQVIARLAPDATVSEAEAQLDVIAARLAEAFPVEDGGFAGRKAVVQRGIGVPPREREALAHTLKVLNAVGGLILLIALANVGNLCLLRATRRRTDLAVRAALGAGPGQLMRHHLGETLLLAVAGGGLGTGLAVWSAGLFQGLAISPLRMTGDVHAVGRVSVDWRVLGFTLGITLGAGLIAGLVPALWLRRADLASELKSGAARASRRRPYLRSALSAIQVAAALTLLVGALLLVGTLRNLRGIDLGFDARDVSIFMMSASSGGYGYEETRGLAPELLARVRAVPGIEDAGLTYAPPFTGINLGYGVRAADMQPTDSAIRTTHMWVSPTYFSTLGIPLLQGQMFEDEDMKPLARGSEGVTIISEALARRLFGQDDAVGRRVSTNLGMSIEQRWYRIVGVVRDSKWNNLIGESQWGPLFYRPLGDDGMRSTLTVVTRSREPGATRRAVEKALAEVMPTVPVYLSTTLAAQVDNHLSNQRLFAGAATACTVLALLLAAVGLYAVVAFSVAEQTKELGIRIAIGARTGQILALVMGQGARVGAMGLLLGVVSAGALSQLIASRLYGLPPLDPAVYLVAGALLVVLVLCASVIPAHRATKVDPMVALRQE